MIIYIYIYINIVVVFVRLAPLAPFLALALARRPKKRDWRRAERTTFEPEKGWSNPSTPRGVCDKGGPGEAGESH